MAFTKAITAQEKPVVNKINAYSDQEALTLLARQQFNLEFTKESEEPAVSNRINEKTVIGGAGKIDLYRTHLVTLHNIIDKISAEEDISNLLVALATGSGKTFVQALWMLILSNSNNHGVFAVPDKLAVQFAKDLKRLLTDSFVDSMFILREKANNPKAEQALQSLQDKTTAGKIIIGASEYLLDKHFHDFEAADSQRTFLSFDEQHLIMKAERRRIRLIELSKQKLSMFLTATPNSETYELSGSKPVAIMSSGQKKEAGQGLFPELASFEARNISDRNKLKDYRFWTLEFWQNMLNGLFLRLTNSIQAEQSSAAVSIVDDLLYYHYEKEGETSARWRMQVPAARKKLCIINDNESLINFCHSLEHSGDRRRDVYRNGNLINRQDVADFFSIPDAEVDVIQKDLQVKREKYEASLKDDESEVNISGVGSLAKQGKYNIFHNLIEYVLTDITGLDEIEHNRLRKHNMDDFQQLVVERFQLRTADYYQQKLAKDIDPKGAQEIGALLAELSTVLQSYIANGKKDEKDLKQFIDNWPLYTQLIDKIKGSNRDLNYAFNKYVKTHLVMGVMTGMKDAETPVAESRPFLGLTREVRAMYDANGSLVADAKKRKHTSLEILSDTSRESVFTPNYLEVPEDLKDKAEEIADNYFRLGFVDIYVSNKKTEGFSDRNLHTVINIADHTLSDTNSPETQIQGIGRDRGLDPTIDPSYIHSLGRQQKTVFDLRNLQKEDYYPDLFTAQKKFNAEYVQVLGAKVSQQIIAWVHKHSDDDETINPDKLKRQVLKFIALALRDINNRNNHQIKFSREQLTKVVSYAMKGLNDEIAHINKPYSISLFLRGLGATLNFLSECYYTFKRIPVAARVWYHSWFGSRTANPGGEGRKHPDDVYIKILNKTSFKNIIRNMSSVLEYKNWLDKSSKGVETHIKKNVTTFLNPEDAKSYAIHQKNLLEPMLLNMVSDAKREQVANALAAFPDSLKFLHANLPLLRSLLEKESADFEATVLSILQQIPGLSDLKVTDIVNYPKKAGQLQKLFSGKPTDLLIGNAQFQASFAEQLGSFFQNEFTQHIFALVTYPQAVQVRQILVIRVRLQHFHNIW